MDGYPWRYTYWVSGQPDNAGGIEHALFLYNMPPTFVGHFNDAQAEAMYPGMLCACMRRGNDNGGGGDNDKGVYDKGL